MFIIDVTIILKIVHRKYYIVWYCTVGYKVYLLDCHIVTYSRFILFCRFVDVHIDGDGSTEMDMFLI